MSEISYFQTYSQSENHVTNNTMLMLRHVYRKSPQLLENFLNALMEQDEIEIGLSFAQQVREEKSIPDAVISQKPLYIYIETKHKPDLDDGQVKRHIQSIAAKGLPKNSAFLVGLTSEKASKVDNERWKAEASESGITFVATTYRELLEALGAVCSEHQDLREIYDDYETFITGQQLLPDQYRMLVAMLCGQSWKENIKHNLHFELATRNPKWARAHFIGVYHSKRISHVGRVIASVVCRMKGDNLIVEDEEFGSIDETMIERIRGVIRDATYFPDFATKSHRYYLVDRFVKTNLRKTSAGGMMGHRYFDIADLAGKDDLKQDASSEEVAALLEGKTYE